MEYLVAVFGGGLTNAQIRVIIAGLAILVVSIALHEFGHAISADKLGDRTPRSQGRVTLNPLAHADPIGTLVFPLLALVLTKGASFGFGWGKPVMVQPHAFTRRFRMRTAHMIVAFSGPAMNVVLAAMIGLVHVVLVKMGILSLDSEVNWMLKYAVILNFILFFFNLIPAPPLDGGAVLEGLLPESALDTWRQISVYGPFILMAVIFIPGASDVFVKPAYWCYESYYDLLQSVVGLDVFTGSGFYRPV